MEVFYQVLQVHEIVVDAPLLHESTLTLEEKHWHPWRQPISQPLGEDIRDVVDEVDWPIVIDHGCVLLLGGQEDVTRVHKLCTAS